MNQRVRVGASTNSRGAMEKQVVNIVERWDTILGPALLRIMLQLGKMQMHKKYLKQVSQQQEELCHPGTYKTCQTQSKRCIRRKPWMQSKRSSHKAIHTLKLMKKPT
nr:uncharacterized protein LOC112731757 isoform X2 [Arachis hypogaea]